MIKPYLSSLALALCLLDAAAQTLPNPGFEVEGENGQPQSWKSVGTATAEWTDAEAHTGAKAASVSDAGTGLFSGWSTDLKIERDRAYTFEGWVKTGGLSPYGPVNGATLYIQFLDKDSQPVGEPILSDPVPQNTAWTQVRTRKAVPPHGTAFIRVISGMYYCKGTAWFDDLSLVADQEIADKVMLIRRADPKPAEGVKFATNLLLNPGIEEGEGDVPRGWSYVGKSAKDWTPEQIAAFHREGRPDFRIGRGVGEWSQETVYAGKRALLNISVDPPLSKNMQWYGRNPVDGYWLSDSMPCVAGKKYLAGGWIRPGVPISEQWMGPLEIQFFGPNGKLMPANGDSRGVRSGIGGVPAGGWTYWATLPHVAPEGATSMRLRFGQELSADGGGWGRLAADNLAVWEVPEGTPEIQVADLFLSTNAFWNWFREAHAKIKPPYLPSPTEAPAYQSCSGWVKNSVPGNVFREPNTPIPLQVVVLNLLGETRKVSLRIKRYDWLGNEDARMEVPTFDLKGGFEEVVTVTVPPTKAYGSFYLEGEVLEGDAVVGEMNGRYAVLPPLNRPRSVENIWGVTTLLPFFGDGRSFETELGEVLKIAGFGVSWFNLGGFDETPRFEKSKREAAWYQALGIRPVLRISHFPIERPIDPVKYEALGREIATEFKGKVAAYGNWGVEQSNHRTPKTPVYRPIIQGKMLSDEEYDQILAALYKGIKSVDQETPVLIGNIASDVEAATVRRLYGAPVQGSFDGAILNAYMSILPMSQNALKEFDKHGDTQKTLWQEETALQRSPFQGLERRWKEGEGANNMVRVWLTQKALIGPRLKAMTFWGFAGDANETDIHMVSPALQPRPHFAAHAVMADALGDARFVADHSQGNISIFEWKRGDDDLFTVWANTGERSVTFDAPKGKLALMDLMGNQREKPATGGVVSLKISSSPMYVSGSELTLSKRLEARLEQGTTVMGKPAVRLILKNNGEEPLTGEAKFTGPVEDGSQREFRVAPHAEETLSIPVRADFPSDLRENFAVECVTSQGAVYFASAGLNFAFGVKATIPPSLDGSWKGWEEAPWNSFGTREEQIWKPYKQAEEKYEGTSDVSGKFRVLWDAQYLYLGVAATDDAFVTQPERGKKGFTADSIEFGVQPDNQLSPSAPYWEYELYLPDGKPPPAASRRLPLPTAMVEDWKIAITPTGLRGDVCYQVAIPWKDLGVGTPEIGKLLSFALVLNDADQREFLGGGRGRVRWFQGLDLNKNPESFGDLILVNTP